MSINIVKTIYKYIFLGDIYTASSIFVAALTEMISTSILNETNNKRNISKNF